MPTTISQRQMIAQFAAITGAPEKVAIRLLRGCAWKLDTAVDSYYHGGDPSHHSSTVANDQLKANLNKLFDSLRTANDEPDTVFIETTANYIQELGASLEDAGFLIIMEIVQAPGLGEMSRTGFVNGWKAVEADTIAKQKAYIASQTRQLSRDNSLFKRVYRYSFFSQKEKAQKALPLENALITWQLLFSPPGKKWVTQSMDWSGAWHEYLETTWTKSVNKDMWNQIFEFYLRTIEDETLGFWTEDSAWPGVIDEFVLWVKKRRGGSPEKMETD